MAPDEPTSAPVMMSSELARVKPMPHAAQPEYEFSIEITTGMSAPPIGRISSNPSSREIPTISQNCSGPCAMVNQTMQLISANPSSALSGCCSGKTSGRPVIRPCSLPKAMIEPVKVMAPMAVPRLISTRLPGSIAPAGYRIGQAGALEPGSLVEMSLGTAIGAITFTGSIIAFGKLQGLITGRPLVFPLQHPLNALLGLALISCIVWFTMAQGPLQFWLIVGISLLLGLLLILPIGGADMPVVISMLNSYSGWAACGIGFTLANSLLIITGALVGSSGAILSYIMCKGMN